jgi:predicted metal-binding membrane protein
VPSWNDQTPRAVSRELTIGVAVLGAAVAAWIVTYRRMRGVDMGPGTDLGELPWFVGVWVVMMAAMMLPSLLPATLAFADLASRRATGARPAPTGSFVAGYLLAWTGFGLLAYAVYRVAAAVAPAALAWSHAGRFVAAGALLGAAAYELTPLKHSCLRRCRGVVALIGRWRDRASGALRMGAEHGLDCIGCCWGLMAALFALGVMSLTWMATIALAVAAEKVLPRGERVVPAVAACLAVGGVWIAVAPASLPGLHVPH